MQRVALVLVMAVMLASCVTLQDTTIGEVKAGLQCVTYGGDLTWKQVAEILGDKAWRLVFSGDPVIDRHERAWFLSLYREGYEVAVESDDRAVLTLGKDEIPYPISLVKRGARWRFDPGEGHEELLSRRIGKDELSALNVVVAYVEAQRQYQREPRRGDGVREYAQKVRSSRGQQDGLYWEAKPGEPLSPLGEFIAQASAEGYGQNTGGQPQPFHGYFFRILTAQGQSAAGGAKSYLVGGRMTGGFALVAWPVQYAGTGVMTFVVNQDGILYEKDLGPDTEAAVKAMSAYDPGEGWEVVE